MIVPEGINILKKGFPQEAVKTLTRKQAIGIAQYLDFQYHSKNKSVVSDEVYDILKDYILDKWPNSTYAKKIGAPVLKRKGVVEVKLPVPMPSMSKIKPGNGSVDRFAEEYKNYVVSDKLDGISLQLVYENGKLTKALTRGDGTLGQDVSGVIPALSVPQRIPIKTLFITRLEFIIPHKSFKKQFSVHEGTGDFSTGRNMGGGLLTRNEPSANVSTFHCVAYDIIGGKGSSYPISKKLSLLKKLGFLTVMFKKLSKIDDEILTKLHSIRKQKSIYEIDGIIVASDIVATTTKSNPKHAKAFKVNSIENSQVVTVREVEWNKSRHNKWIPRVRIDPIILGGVKVQYFTAHNAFFIRHGYRYSDRNKGLPVRPINEGSVIRVLRSGDVIPYIVEVVKPSRKPSHPEGQYFLDENGVHYISDKTKDEGVSVKNMIHFFKSMKIEGVKEGTIKKLRAAGYTTLSSILTADAEDFMEIEGFQQTSAENLERSIRKGLKEATFARTAAASGIFGDKIGEKKLQEIVNTYPNIMQMAQLPVSELENKIRQVRLFSNLSKQIAVGLPKFVKFVEKHGIKIRANKTPSSTELSNLNVIFTSLRDAQLEAEIVAKGGKIASTVKNANILIAKEGAYNNKIEYAQTNNIPIMTVDKFRRKYL